MSLRGVRNERRSNHLTLQEIASAKLVLSLSKETPRNDSKFINKSQTPGFWKTLGSCGVLGIYWCCWCSLFEKNKPWQSGWDHGHAKEAFLTLLGAIGVDYSYGSPTCSRAPNISVRAAYNKQKKHDPPLLTLRFLLFTSFRPQFWQESFLYLNYTHPILKLYSLCCAILTYFFSLLRSAQGRFGVVILAG